MIIRQLQIALLAIALLCAARAFASTGSPESEEHASPHGHPDYALALIGVYAAGFHHGEDVVHHGGVGVAFHAGLIPDWLEIEVAAKAVFAGDGHTHFPLEVALKIPFQLADRLFLSVGLGPVVALNLHDGAGELSYGGCAGAELYYWYRPWGGFVIGAAYELLHHEGLVQKIVAIAGPAFGW